MQRRDLKELITRGLSRAERLIIVLYYFEEMTMKEIGATLDLSESRVSQMHSSILLRLKAQISDRRKEIAETAAVS
jgi:RNA polymerase sigma factor for flagellar operon FliA